VLAAQAAARERLAQLRAGRRAYASAVHLDPRVAGLWGDMGMSYHLQLELEGQHPALAASANPRVRARRRGVVPAPWCRLALGFDALPRSLRRLLVVTPNAQRVCRIVVGYHSCDGAHQHPSALVRKRQSTGEVGWVWYDPDRHHGLILPYVRTGDLLVIRLPAASRAGSGARRPPTGPHLRLAVGLLGHHRRGGRRRLARHGGRRGVLLQPGVTAQPTAGAGVGRAGSAVRGARRGGAGEQVGRYVRTKRRFIYLRRSLTAVATLFARRSAILGMFVRGCVF
jgi:hypothetical protein